MSGARRRGSAHTRHGKMAHAVASGRAHTRRRNGKRCGKLLAYQRVHEVVVGGCLPRLDELHIVDRGLELVRAECACGSSTTAHHRTRVNHKIAAVLTRGIRTSEHCKGSQYGAELEPRRTRHKRQHSVRGCAHLSTTRACRVRLVGLLALRVQCTASNGTSVSRGDGGLLQQQRKRATMDAPPGAAASP